MSQELKGKILVDRYKSLSLISRKFPLIRIMPFINPDTGDDKIFELYYWDDGQWIFFETVREKEKTFW